MPPFALQYDKITTGETALAREPAFITPLENMSIISIAGEQRNDYFHGQLTVATKNFNAYMSRLSAHCDFKGKMFSMSILSEYEEAFLMAADEAAASESLAQLKKYGVFSKVDINLNTDLDVFGVAGSDAFEAIKSLFESLSTEHLAVSSNEYGQAICFNDTSIRYLLYLNGRGQALLQQSENGLLQNMPERWEALEIEAGIGNVQAQSIGEFVPQMLNLQCLGAIDFDKGCYMGQEVVARTKFLGKNKRAAFVLEANIDAQNKDELIEKLQVGSNVEIQLGDNWRRGGVINRFALVEDKVHMLAVMANDTEVGSVVRLKDTELVLKVKPLAYTLD